MDRATGMLDENMTVKPGTLSMCIKCTSFLKFDSGLKLVQIGPGDFKSLPTTVRDLLFKMRQEIHRIRAEHLDGP
jgi:hypothetical protein